MTDVDRPEHLTLFEALMQWCSPVLVERIRAAERRNYASSRSQISKPKLLSEEDWLQPHEQSWLASGDIIGLYDAWRELEVDLQTRVERGELYLEGILSSDDPQAQPEAIPNFWAAELRFDAVRNTATRGDCQYLAITVSKRPSPWASLEGRTASTVAPRTAITSASVRELSDDEVLLLLEDHARRVIENDATLVAPGKISLLPIVRGKMVHRAERGDLMPTLSQEAAALAAWIESKVTLHQTPTASTISKVLGKEYATLLTRSNAAIQRSKA